MPWCCFCITFCSILHFIISKNMAGNGLEHQRELFECNSSTWGFPLLLREFVLKLDHSLKFMNLTNRCYFAMCLFSHRSQTMSKCDKNKKVHTGECVTDVLITFGHHLVSSYAIFYCADPWQHGINVVTWCKSKMLLMMLSMHLSSNII